MFLARSLVRTLGFLCVYVAGVAVGLSAAADPAIAEKYISIGQQLNSSPWLEWGVPIAGVVVGTILLRFGLVDKASK